MRRLLSIASLALLFAPAAQAAMQLRNLAMNPEFVCPGQAITLTFEAIHTVNGGNQTAGVISTNGATWDDAGDYLFMDSGHASGSTASSTAGVPFGPTTRVLTGGAPDGFWHPYSFSTVVPASLPGTSATFLIKGYDGGAVFVQGMAFDAIISITAEITCTKKAIYNVASLLDTSASGRLVIMSSCGTPTFTHTRTRSPTPSFTRTASPSPSLSPSPSFTRTATPSPSATPSITPSPSPSFSRTASPTPSHTPTISPSLSPSFSRTASPTPSHTPTISPSLSPSFTRTASPTPSHTPTISPSPSPSFTRTVSPTPTASPSPTWTPSVNPSPSPSHTVSPLASPTDTGTPTPTFSATPTRTASATATLTSSASLTATESPSPTPSRTASPTASESASATLTRTDSPTPSETVTATPSPTASPTRTDSPAFTATSTPSSTATPSATRSFTESFTFSSTRSATPSPSTTQTLTISPSQTASPTPSGTRTGTPTSTMSASITASFSPSPTSSASPTMTGTRTASPSITVSPTVTETRMAAPFKLQVSLFNSAGERVRLLFDGFAANLPLAIASDQPVLVAGQTPVALQLGVGLSSGGQSLNWGGENDTGQFVEGGSYYFKLEFQDNFGQTSTFIQGVEVLSPKGENAIGIYSASGELVYEQSFQSLTFSATNLVLDAPAFAVSIDPSTGLDYQPLSGKILDASGASWPWSWNGRNQRGEPVRSGVYTLRLVQKTPSGSKVIVRQVSVLDSGISSDPRPLAFPNPATPAGLRAAGGLTLSYQDPLKHRFAMAGLYNAAGELIAQAGDPAMLGRIQFPAAGLAPGIYVLEFRFIAQDGRPGRRLIKAALLN